MNKKKIFWTITAVAVTGACASTFFYNYDEDSMIYKVFSSGGFAFVAGLVVYNTYLLYKNE